MPDEPAPPTAVSSFVKTHGGLQRRLILSYVVVGISVAIMSLGAIHWVHQREEAIDTESHRAVLHTEQLSTLTASASEGALSYVLTGVVLEKNECHAKLALLESHGRQLRDSAMGAIHATALNRVDAETMRVVQSTNLLFAEYEAGGLEVRGESMRNFESAIDALVDETQALTVAINREADLRTLQARKLLDWTMLGIGAVAVLLATWMGSVLGRRITRPLQRLRDAAIEFGHGNLALATMDVRADYEVGELAQAFKAMATDVERHRRERLRLENEQRQGQKLEAIGRLASGIAHEINTPVQFVSHSLHFIREATTDLIAVVEKYRSLRQGAPPSMAPRLNEAQKSEDAAGYAFIVKNLPAALDRSTEGLARIASIIQAMNQFAHPGQKTATTIDLNATIASTLTIASSEYRYVAELKTDFGELPLIRCYQGELNQAILNIIVNAAHAIEDVVKGTEHKGCITVQTRREAGTVVISIGDTGNGIPEQAREHIFDPFFTTKEVGRGTGQGLALAWAIVVDKHGGTLTFETEIGKGTTFVIRLPVEGSVDAAAA